VEKLNDFGNYVGRRLSDRVTPNSQESLVTVRILITSSILLVASAASAQPVPEAGDQSAGGGVIYESETTYDFEDDFVEGQLVRPDGELVTGQRHGKESSLIRIRADFIPEMVQSVEDL
jgi:hypothetical protein